MKTVMIGMSRKRLLALAAEIQTKLIDPVSTVTVTLEGAANDGGGEWITVELSNDDMERPEVAESVLVDIEEQ